MNIKYSHQAAKFLDKQNDKVFNRIVTAINKLPKGDIRKMKGQNDLYRLRIGGIRILFKIKDRDISIDKIDNRGQVYKD